MADYLYVHLDTTNNSIVTKGIGHHDFYRSFIHRPQNILLLNPSTEAGHFEPHTALKVIEGQENVDEYLASLGKKWNKDQVKWIDFTELAMLKQLTAQEIAELLYFGHMKLHLRSPFFYKLQNNFAYFEVSEEINRVYYRYLDEFFRILGDKIVSNTLEKLNEKKSFFKRSIPVTKMEEYLLKQLRPYLLDGVAFYFAPNEDVGKEYQVCLYLLDDWLIKTNENKLLRKKPDAYLMYNISKKTWRLKEENLPY